MNQLITFAMFAKVKGVSRAAVCKAMARGRLDRSVTRDANGRRCLIAALAGQEWEQNASRLTKGAGGL